MCVDLCGCVYLRSMCISCRNLQMSGGQQVSLLKPRWRSDREDWNSTSLHIQFTYLWLVWDSSWFKQPFVVMLSLISVPLWWHSVSVRMLRQRSKVYLLIFIFKTKLPISISMRVNHLLLYVWIAKWWCNLWNGQGGSTGLSSSREVN